MAINAGLLSPSGPPLAADLAAISITAALETSVTAATTVASATIAVTVTNDDDHLHNGHDVNDRLHDRYDNIHLFFIMPEPIPNSSQTTTSTSIKIK